MAETIKGLKSLLKKLDALGKDLDNEVGIIVEANAHEIEAKAKVKAPIDTGKLKQSIKAIPNGHLTWKILANATGIAPYAAGVEYGTHAHIIRPKNKKALKFKIGGKDIYAKEVKHPGTKPRPFLYPAFNEQRGQYIKDLKDLLDRETSKI